MIILIEGIKKLFYVGEYLLVGKYNINSNIKLPSWYISSHIKWKHVFSENILERVQNEAIKFLKYK